MHTLPSVEDVPMYIALDGVFGTTGGFGFAVRGEFVLEASDVTDGVRPGVARD